MRRIAAFVVLAAATAACSAKDAPKADSAKVAQAGAAAAPANRGKFDPATHTATIYAKDFSYEAPDSITAGLTTFHLINEGTTLHHVQLVRLDSGKTADDLGAAMKNPGPPPMWAVFLGGPNAPNPHAESEASFDLQPGNYVVLCLVDMPGGVPHFMKGMVKPFKVVTGTGTPAAAPTADATIRLADYSFALEGNLTAGKHVVKVVNSGPQPHEVEIARLAEGKTIKDLEAWIKGGMQGPPPGDAIGGVAALVPTASGYINLDLTAGNYVLICFIPDGKDGKPHLEHGMIKEVKVN